MTTVQEEVWEILRKLALSSEETERRMQETDRRMQETDLQMKETDRKLKEVTKAIGRLGNRLGEFVEEMVRPAVVRLFQQRGIAVHQVFRGAYAERDGDAMEIDLLVVNSVDVVLVEVKSELKADDVKEHISRLERFKKLFPQYAGFRVMGAVAGMVVAEETARFAYRQGLFVLAQSGDTVTIRNDADFQPVVW
ncbi:MAG: DUF3782 domain-containing protein [Candidatus Methylumidiphilus alinenensis]|uniref:DUF3782 domain-containing protein n=1 Tax=Candidatus Methylumidiphilus alinenensis TaxID=2202197 RepID=A0A2W4QMR5_9GAMM|nr:MAG: DUF3782 domain-containing protein [Candidatus Methylumidiphilus alinenensis]